MAEISPAHLGHAEHLGRASEAAHDAELQVERQLHESAGASGLGLGCSCHQLLFQAILRLVLAQGEQAAIHMLAGARDGCELAVHVFEQAPRPRDLIHLGASENVARRARIRARSTCRWYDVRKQKAGLLSQGGPYV